MLGRCSLKSAKPSSKGRDRPGASVPVGPVQSVIGQLLRIGAEHVTRRYPGLLRDGRRARVRMPVFAAVAMEGSHTIIVRN